MERQRPSDEELINIGIEQSYELDEPITEHLARLIASQVHGGQWTAMYFLASTGTVERETLLAEIAEDREEFEDDPQVTSWLSALTGYIEQRHFEQVRLIPPLSWFRDYWRES